MPTQRVKPSRCLCARSGRIATDERYDGLFVLRTDTDHDAETVAAVYKTLWMVEDTFRTAKSILETRPIYHKCDETIRGHVFCSFLALCLKRELEIRMHLAGHFKVHHHRVTYLKFKVHHFGRGFFSSFSGWWQAVDWWWREACFSVAG